MSTKVAIAGGSGYAGGELLRLLLDHTQVDVTQVTSQRYGGRFVHNLHPNLRGRTGLKFCEMDDLLPVEMLFQALPHGRSAGMIERFSGLAERIIDLSADFRLREVYLYEKTYGNPHPAQEWLPRFVYGLPEIYRQELSSARYASGVGCNATAVNLALLPLARAGLIERAVVDLKVGSSEGGSAFSEASHHPERSGSLRSFAPTGHRHQAEVNQALGSFDLHFTVTAVEMVRGVLCTAHVFLNEVVDEKSVWRLYREQYAEEPFVRLVKERRGIYRYPEPKILSGSNYCDVGFAVEEGTQRLVVLSAIDNLMKGAAGSAVQAMNVMMGWPETMGLTFSGLHPV
ncbi:MAG: N-acetyl-gamma-glutamyl-phosphate reductase [Candidatus Promineifilaceae bacterium]|jgi:N-acetyl-gamma-glutamyl-phosphate/LysW-gamma-L-alpha-aminoadipyl-6-phosphate reductase